MEEKCTKYWRAGMPCPAGLPLLSGSACSPSPPPHDPPSPGSITFGVAAPNSEQPVVSVPTPRYDVPGPMMKTSRDPALSLMALSGIEPTGPLMVEVPLVQNNSTFAPTQALAGWRIGFAGRYVRVNNYQRVEQGAPFVRALDILREAGAQLVPVDVQWVDDTLQFTLQTHPEIDNYVIKHRLDAMVSEGESSVFHGACKRGYPGLCEPLEEGATLWFYSARWSRDSLATLVRVYRQRASCEPGSQDPLQGTLIPPTA